MTSLEIFCNKKAYDRINKGPKTPPHKLKEKPSVKLRNDKIALQSRPLGFNVVREKKKLSQNVVTSCVLRIKCL